MGFLIVAFRPTQEQLREKAGLAAAVATLLGTPAASDSAIEAVIAAAVRLGRRVAHTVSMKRGWKKNGPQTNLLFDCSIAHRHRQEELLRRMQRRLSDDAKALQRRQKSLRQHYLRPA